MKITESYDVDSNNGLFVEPLDTEVIELKLLKLRIESHFLYHFKVDGLPLSLVLALLNWDKCFNNAINVLNFFWNFIWF